MAKEIVTASLTINFDKGKGSNQFLVEIDERDDGPNAGKDNFRPGDTVYLLQYQSPNIEQVRTFVTSGSLSQGGLVSVEKEEVIAFAKEEEASTRYPVEDGSISWTWYGPSPTTIKYEDGKFIVPKDTVAIGKVKYRSPGRSYSLSGVAFPAALVLFTGVAITE